LSISFGTLEIDSPVVLSAALDPRFRKLLFLSESQQTKLLDILVRKASTDNNAECSNSSSTDACKIVEEMD